MTKLVKIYGKKAPMIKKVDTWCDGGMVWVKGVYGWIIDISAPPSHQRPYRPLITDNDF